jgi:hypothetical protein
MAAATASSDGGQRPSIRRMFVDAVLRHPLPEGAEHPCRRVDRDDFADEQCERERIPPRSRPDVEPHVVGRASSRNRSRTGSSVRRGFARKSDVTGP